MNPRPPFMNGLLTARNILLALKQKKLREKGETNIQAGNENIQQLSAVPQNIQNEMMQSPKQQLQIVDKPSTKQQLSQTINEIGRELYELHEEIQTYDIVFQKMIDYYQQNHKIVQDNQHLKRKSFQLQEKIKHFKAKIKQNYERIQVNQRQGFEFQTILQHSLQQFLVGERERALIDPLPNIKPQKKINLSLKVDEEQNPNISINLNWRELSQKTAKKVTVRKQKASQDTRQTLFNSKIYNI